MLKRFSISDHDFDVAMRILPQTKLDCLRLAVFPFKAYAVIAPSLILVLAPFLHTRHSGPAEALVLVVLSLFPCAAILLLAALVFAIVGAKDFAISCAGFGAAAFVIGYTLLPSLATA